MEKRKDMTHTEIDWEETYMGLVLLATSLLKYRYKCTIVINYYPFNHIFLIFV